MKQDQLHQLLRNLTKSEKRYFRLFSKRSGDSTPKNYLYLFDVLEGMEHYDEVKLVKELEKRAVSTKYLSADKNYLYVSILDALRTYNSNYSAKQQVRRQLDFADILSEKGLLTQAAKVLKKTKTIATQNDATQYLPEILQIERKLKGNALNEKDYKKAYEEMRKCATTVYSLYENEFYYRKNNLLRLRLGKTRDKEKLVELETRIAENRARQVEKPPFAARKWFLQAEAAASYIKNDTLAEFQTNQELLQLMKSTAGYIKVNPLEYISIFSRILILSKQIAPEEYPALLQQFIDFADTVNRENRKVKARVYTIGYSTEMVRIIQTGNFKQGLELMPKVERLMKDYQDIINPAFCLNNYYKFAYICMGTDAYDKALEYLNILLNDYNSNLRPDIYGYAKLLICICHFELGNISLLAHLTSTAKYYLKKENRLFKTERLLLQFMTTISKLPHKSPNFAGLQKQINELDSSENAQSYFDFNRWIRAKVEGNNFSQVP